MSPDTQQSRSIDELNGSEDVPSMNWIKIPAGEFIFGSSENTPCRAPIAETTFKVQLTHSFEISETEITQAQWEMMALPNPSKDVSNDKPVTFVSYYEALVWCNKLSLLEELDTCYDLSSCKNAFGTGCSSEEGCIDEENSFICKANIHKFANYYECPGYRLPTVAEWEYAAKGGTKGDTYGGDVHYVPTDECEEEPALEDIAWYCNNSGGTIHPVKQKQANPWGLYDILGNVYEWVDYYFHGQSLTDEYSSEDIVLTDPVGPQTGDTVSLNGGAFNQTGCYVRPSRPLYFWPYTRISHTGFRPVRTLFGDEANSDAD